MWSLLGGMVGYGPGVRGNEIPSVSSEFPGIYVSSSHSPLLVTSYQNTTSHDLQIN